ncbi:putative ribonuclease H-like domain-containing protein [Tanacetum coccineum]
MKRQFEVIKEVSRRDQDVRNLVSMTIVRLYLRMRRDGKYKSTRTMDIITNGDQETTDPASSSVPKTSLAANARRNNEKALNILLSTIPDRQLLSFHDATNAKTLWTAIKARFGGNEASKKMQKNLLKQQFETFTIGSREELKIQHTKEVYHHVVACRCYNYSGQPGLDDWSLMISTTNLNCKSMNLKGVFNSNSQNIAFLSTEVKGSTLKQSTVEPAHIPKGYNQAASSKVQTAPNCASHSDEIIWGKDKGKIYEENRRPIDSSQNGDLVIWTGATKLMKHQFPTLMATNSKEDTNDLDSIEVILKTHEKNEYAWGDKYEQMEYDLKMRDLKLEEKQKELDQALRERDDFKIKLEKWSNAAVLQNEVLNKQRYLSDKTCIGFGVEYSSSEENNNSSGDETLVDPLYENFKREKAYKAVPPPTEEDLKDYAIIDSGCSGRGRISGKGTIKTSCIDFEKVSYVEELKFNLLSVSQICDKKHNVLFTDKECLILSPKFKFVDEDLVILRAPRKNDVYSLDLKNIIPSGGITCLVAKATKDEAVLWHRRLGHVNFKNINKLVKGNLVRGLPSKTFKLDHSCLACRKGKQHRASCKKIEERTIREPLELLHMDLFGPVSVESVNRKKYCLVVTDDCSKFQLVFFLAYKDETYDMLHDLIVGLENKLRHKVKTIRCDHGTEFKNQLMNEFCAKKGIKREYSIARTPQQNGVAERKNRTLMKLLELMLGNSPFTYSILGLSQTTLLRYACKERKLSNSGGNGINSMMMFDDLEVSIVHCSWSKHSCSSDYAFRGKSTKTAFEKEKKRIALEKGKECVDSTFTLSTANTPPQSTGNTPTDSDDDIPKDGVFSTNSFDAENTDTEEGGAADYNNMDPTIDVTSTPTLRIHKIHPQMTVISAKSTAGVQTRRKLKDSTSNQHQALLSFIYKQNRTNHKDQQTCLFACFLSQEEPKKVSQALADESWVEAMQEELLQFKLQEVFEDPRNPNKVYRSFSMQLYGLHQAPKHGLFEDHMQKEFKMSSMGELTFSFWGFNSSQSHKSLGHDRCSNSEDKYVKDILNKVENLEPLSQHPPPEVNDWVVLMYLTASRQTNVVCCLSVANFQVTPKLLTLGIHHDKYIQASGDVNIFGRRLSLGQYKKLRQYALSPLQKSEYVASCKVVYNESTFHVRRAGREGGGEFPLRRRRSIIHYSEQNTGTFEIVMSKGSLGKVLQQFGLPHLSDDQDVPHIRRRGKLAKRCLILRNHSKLTYLFDDAHGVECFPKQVIWDELKILGYEGIPPLTPHMLEVVTALAAEEAHSTSPHSRDARDAQGTPDQSAAQASVSQRTAEVQGRILKKQTLSQVQINSQAEGQTQEPVKGGSSSGETSRFLGRKSAPCEAKETKKEAKEENDLHILVAIQSQPQPSKPSQATDPKDKGQVAKKGLGGGGGGQAEWDAEEERKRLEELKKAKPKTTSLAQERNQMMNFLKGQGYKNLQKLKYPQMKELYDKVQESIKDSFKDFIPMAQRKKWGGGRCLKERENKKTFMKRKATISEEQPSKKLKLRTETVDEIRNYLRVHTLELEDGTMIHMLAERRYPLSRELMIRMLDHGMEVEDESEIAITLIHLFILWTTEDGDNP